ncbi:MAG: helix-turn-helix domain-containing protein [Gemmatimonadota bacterium]
MSPRPRKASDADIMAATQRVMMRVGPRELTLAEIGAEAGVTAGALVQRFGSKRSLLLELARAFAESVPEMYAQMRAASASPLATLRTYVDCMAQLGESPAALAHHMSYLQIDLTDPDFRDHTRAQAAAARAAIQGWVEEAIELGELRPDLDPPSVARSIEVTVSGSLWTWAFYQDGSIRNWMQHDLAVLLAPLLGPKGWISEGKKRRRSLPKAGRPKRKR